MFGMRPLPRCATIALAGFLLLIPSVGAQGNPATPLKISSTAFSDGADIPKQYTCEGADMSPALSWSGAPSSARSFALIADDPDAPVGTWVHWVYFDLPANATSLPENVAKSDDPPSGGHQGHNDFKKVGYGGPCPPAGKPHRYFFKLYALDRQLGLGADATKQDVEKAMQGHTLAQGQLMGKYKR
jgi:Raf kinase inhibitor-like YbhB/YbcL family protein